MGEDAETTSDRPSMPDSYGIAARLGDEGQLPWRWAREQLQRARNYWVVSMRPDGRPHAMPVWGVWLGEMLYFATDRASRKARNLARNPHIVIHLESGDDTVVLEGVAAAATDVALLARFVDAYDAKYQFRLDTGDDAQVVYAVRARVVFAWQESSFVPSATRWRFSAE
jgi:PPOX class probable F420-dependent enzyme